MLFNHLCYEERSIDRCQRTVLFLNATKIWYTGIVPSTVATLTRKTCGNTTGEEAAYATVAFCLGLVLMECDKKTSVRQNLCYLGETNKSNVPSPLLNIR